MNILITGATGFIGRNLLMSLRNDDVKVFCLVRDDVFKDGFDVFLEKHGIAAQCIKGDLTDVGSLSKVVSASEPDLVIHMAALTPVRHSWERIREYMEVNYFGTINLMDSLKSGHRHARLIYYSTMEVLKPYDSYAEYIIKMPTKPEDVPVYPTTPYAASKLAAEGYVKTQTYLDACIVRPCNTFDRSIMGLNEESMNYFVEKAVISLLSGRKPVFDGPPDRVRTWMHVDDHINALRQIIYGDWRHGQIFHIAPENTTLSCAEIYVNIITFGYGLLDNPHEMPPEKLQPVWGVKPRPYDPPILAMKGGNVPNWRPKSLGERIIQTIENWKRVLENAKTL